MGRGMAVNGGRIGHNADGLTVTVEARLFNSVLRSAGPGGLCRRVTLPAGSSVGDLIRALAIPRREVFLVMRNGRDVTASLRGGVNLEAAIDHGDVVAISGPVPYSWGYGAPVV